MTSTRIPFTDRVLVPMPDSQSAATDHLLPGRIQQLLEVNQQQLVLAESCTAGLAAARLGGVPGISANFCGSAVVYQEGTKQDWLDLPADLLADHGAVSEPVAGQMAARSLDQTSAATLALSITGHLGPAAPADLDGQVFVGLALQQPTDQAPTVLVIGRRLEPAGREDRQRMAADYLLETSLRALQVLDACRQLGQGESHRLISSAGLGTEGQLVFPGAFHPLHDGHREMIRVAERMTGSQVTLEISLENVDKPALQAAAAVARIVPLEANAVWMTRAATFTEKAELFPGSTFVVGADTIARIGQPRYYDPDSLSCEQAIEKITASNCRFLVFGRMLDRELQADESPRFRGLDDLDIPGSLREISEAVSEQEFRLDISSRQLRARDG